MPDGKHIVTASMDRTIRVWLTDYRDLIDYACTRVGRDLTQDERNRYGVSGQDPTCPQFGNMIQPLLADHHTHDDFNAGPIPAAPGDTDSQHPVMIAWASPAASRP